MILRELEPEMMDTAEEASDYDAMDHAAVNRSFVEDLLREVGGPLGRVLDAGSGTARVPIDLCRAEPQVLVTAVEYAAQMLAVARGNILQTGLSDRISLVHADAKSTPFPNESFPVVISNSVVHHMPEPLLLLRELWRLVQPAGVLFIRDLVRPAATPEIESLLERYAPLDASSPDAETRALRQRALFAASLRAALTLEEVRSLAKEIGVIPVTISKTSDRHWTLVAKKGGRS